MKSSGQPVPFGTVLFGPSVSTPEMAAAWSEEKTFESWLKVERAIVEAQKELRIIPAEAAETILGWLSPEKLKPSDVSGEQEKVEHLMVAFLRSFRRICGEAAEHFHVGPTTQDILDTGLTLQMRDAYQLVRQQLDELENELLDQAEAYKRDVLIARTHQQHAVPTTFGYILASWALELRDHSVRFEESERRWLLGNVSGAAGNQNALVQLVGLAATDELERRVCERLGLGRPLLSLHSRMDRFVEVLHCLSLVCGSVGRMALNIRFWRSSEVGEVRDSRAAETFSSSTMPNKDNPEECERIAGLAVLVRHHARSLEDIQMEGVRDSTRMPALNVAVPQAWMLSSRMLAGFLGVLRRLEPDRERMLKNLNHEYVLQQAVAERLMIEIYRKTGRKMRGHERLHACARLSSAEGIPLRTVIRDDPELGPLFEDSELERLFEPATYLGNAVDRTDAVIRYLRAARRG
jgi:adenylosuccinate lyase